MSLQPTEAKVVRLKCLFINVGFRVFIVNDSNIDSNILKNNLIFIVLTAILVVFV